MCPKCKTARMRGPFCVYDGWMEFMRYVCPRCGYRQDVNVSVRR